MGNKCEAIGCDASISAHLNWPGIFCHRHWMASPKRLRRGLRRLSMAKKHRYHDPVIDNLVRLLIMRAAQKDMEFMKRTIESQNRELGDYRARVQLENMMHPATVFNMGVEINRLRALLGDNPNV
jgi:hypothetical protein